MTEKTQKKTPIKTLNISLSNSDKIGLITNLSTMLGAGIPILEVIETLLEDVKGPQRKVLQVLHDDIVQGKHVYESFEKFPNIFNKVTTNILKAAEEAGGLETTLQSIKNQIIKDIEFKDKIMFALLYPSVILCVMGGVMLTVLIVVVPKISTVFQRMNVELPLPTRVMLFVSDLLLKYTIPTMIGLAAIIFLAIFMWKRNKQAIVQPLTALPYISPIIRRIDLTVFARSLASLLGAGIPITTALELTQGVVIKREIAETIGLSRQMILSGKSLSEGLKSHKGIIPVLMIKIIETGEKSGSLDKSLTEIAEYLDYSVSNDLRSATALLEPVLMVFVGLLIGGVMLAIITPIYGLIGSVGG
jgi:type II secretory pathway component PulF